MFDILPFPRISGSTPEEQIPEIIKYLNQFKESLEFMLMNIGTENLSPELKTRLSEIEKSITDNRIDIEEEIAQISNKEANDG